MSYLLVPRTLEHDEGAQRAEIRMSSPSTQRGPLRPATAETWDHVGLRRSARLLAGAGPQIVTEYSDNRPRLPRRALRGWFLAELLGLPRIVRQGRSAAAESAHDGGRARAARPERLAARRLVSADVSDVVL